MPLGALAFWVCMLVAARRFPTPYDWRYITTSQLIYPERNPAGHLWASAALMTCAGAGLLWVWTVRSTVPFRRLWVLAAGYACMTLSSLLPERWHSIRNGHEILAIAGFVGVCCGLVLVSLNLRFPRRYPTRAPQVVLALIAFSPIAMAAITQVYLTWWRPEVPWVGPAWRTLGLPFYLSFAFWEWVTCALLSAYMTGIGLAVGEQACKTSSS
jgi:hypothetical protein